MSIPRRIIQTARSHDLTPLAKASAANLKLLHPTWEYIFFDDSKVIKFLEREFPEYVGVFQSFPRNIQRIDFFRYLAIYRLGGFYFDLDVLLWSSLDPLLIQNCVFPFEELTLSRHLRDKCAMDWEFGNYGFGASAGHPFLKTIIQNCVKAQREPAWSEPMMQGIPSMFRSDFRVLNTTGPGLISRTLAENLEMAPDIKILFPDNVLDKETWHHFGDFGVHLMNGSWRDRGNYFHRRMANLWETWAIKRLMPESVALGNKRSLLGTKVPKAIGSSSGVAR